VYTRSAELSLPPSIDDARDTVAPVSALVADGRTWTAVAAQVDARRWQRFGRAVLLHNGPPTNGERRRIALLNGPAKAALAAFTALEDVGMRGWERETTHLLVPGGTRVRRVTEVPVRVHFAAVWDETRVWPGRRVERPASAAARAAGTFARPRPAIGVLAAAVQQRLVRPRDVEAIVRASPRLRHRHALLLATHDIAMGAQALSEIDFARLCRQHGLPEPRRQSVRRDRFGRRRYFDAEWITRTGRRLVAEVDGALHLVAETWWADQTRQNEIVLSDRVVLRFPSVMVRHEPVIVVDQLRRGLDL
jgi:hypothetical protein